VATGGPDPGGLCRAMLIAVKEIEIRWCREWRRHRMLGGTENAQKDI
jgi:hypothetical protein